MQLRTVFIAAILLLAPASSAQDQRQTSTQLNEKGIALVKMGEFEEAIKLFRQARALMPADPILRRNLAAAHSQLGVKLVSEGKLDEAVKELRTATSLEPGVALYHLNLGIALNRQRKVEDAAQSLERAVQVDPKSAAAHFELGNLRYRQGELERAVRLLTRAAALDVGNAEYKKALERAVREHTAEKRYTVEESPHFKLSWDGSRDVSIGSRVLRVLEDAWERIGVELEIHPTEKTRVILYTETEFRKVTGVHGWVTGLYDGRIRIPVKDFGTAEREIKGTIYHEYTHVAVQSITRVCPSWLNEGLAQVYEGRESRSAASRVRKAHASDSLIALKDLTKSFTRFSDVEKARLAYAQSLSLVLFIIDQHGPDRVGRFLRYLGKGMAEQEAADEAFHKSLADIFAAWKEAI
jgi:tetratricopeptide (TPR) repeat protein